MGDSRSLYSTIAKPVLGALLFGAGVLAATLLLAPAAEANEIDGLRLGERGSGVRLVIESREKPVWHVLALRDPYRVVVDIANTSAGRALKEPKSSLPLSSISGIRFGDYGGGVFRIVMDATKPTVIRKTLLLKPTGAYPFRLVFDLKPAAGWRFARWEKRLPERPKDFIHTAETPSESPSLFAKLTNRLGRDIGRNSAQAESDTRPMVVIDPGHGGVDPGALGRRVAEKHVVLSVAEMLGERLKGTGRYRVTLTRERDVFVPLRERVEIARKHKADLFISLHADAISKRSIRGLSIYTLSARASDKEAAAFAKRENQADIIAGVNFANAVPSVMPILIDLAQRESKVLSVSFAGQVLEHAGRATRVVDNPHRSAGFRVLTAPDVPSVLIELGFLTNRQDENLLLRTTWRRRVTGALVKAIDDYFSENQLALQIPHELQAQHPH